MIRTSVRLRRALVALAMTTAAGATVVGVAEPAHAVTSCSTTTVLDEGGKTGNHVMSWNDFEAVHVNVTATCAGSSTDYVTTGTTTLYASTDGGSHWSTVKSATGYSADYISFYGTNIIKRTTLFKAVYSGGTDSTYTFTGSQDGIIIGLIRDTKLVSHSCSRKGCTAVHRITPSASISGLKVVIQKHSSSGWHKNSTEKAGSTGKIKHFYKPGKYRLVLPGKRGLLKSTYGPITVS